MHSRETQCRIAGVVGLVFVDDPSFETCVLQHAGELLHPAVGACCDAGGCQLTLLLLELAQAQMAREIFPEAPLKYMPPTKYMTGNIFKGHIQDALFNLIGVWTNQGIQLLGMMTEAMHTPHMGDRYLALENAQYVMNNARMLGDEIEFKKDGIIQKRAQQVLDESIELLEQVRDEGMFDVLSRGVFADVFRPRDRGKGLDGVVMRSPDYYNPLEDVLRAKVSLDQID